MDESVEDVCVTVPVYPEAQISPPLRDSMHMPQEPVLRCPECARAFTQARSYKRHLREYHQIPCHPEDLFLPLRDALNGHSTCRHCLKQFTDFYRLRDHINKRVCLSFDPAKDTIVPICDRPDLRMHLRYKSIPGLLLNKALMSELANHCAYCHSAIAARSIRRHYKDAHPQLLQYEPLHRTQVYGFAQLGSGKGQCILCDQASHNVQSHQCGVLFQFSVMLGQTYDVSHFPVMPVMLRTLPEDRPEDDRSTSRLTRTSTTQDEKQKASPSDSRQSSTSCSQTGHRGSSSLHKCTRCQMAFLSAIGLTQHMQESHDASSSAQTTAPPAQVSKKLKTSRTIQQMLGLPPAGPIPEAPKQFECPLCLETIGRKALIGHLRREHQAVHTGAFSFVPDQDMIQDSLTCRHCYLVGGRTYKHKITRICIDNV